MSFDGVSGSAVPVLVEVLRKTVTVTGTALTPSPKDLGDDALATAKHTATGEGTDGVVLYRDYIHPQGGKHQMIPLGDEIVCAKSGMLAIKCTAPAAVNCIAGLAWKH